jgi:hypothetical protein
VTRERGCWFLPWLLLAGFLGCSSAGAQDDPAHQAYLKAVEAAKEAPVEEAVALFEEVIREFPASSFAGHSMLAQTERYIAANMPDEALANAERALAEHARAYITGRAFTQKVRVLLYMLRRPQEALDFIIDGAPEYDNLLLPADYAELALYEYDARFRLGDRAGALDALAQGALYHPQLLLRWGFFSRYAPALRAAGMRREALSAAKGAFACCAFNEAEIKSAADGLIKSWVALGELGRAGEFLVAQEDPAKPNPLQEVPWPGVPDDDKEFMLVNTAGNVPAQIQVLLYCGDCDEALTLATAGVGDAKDAKQITGCIEQIARCLKAKDLNLTRANAFLEYVKEGEGNNPLRDM